MAPRDFPMTPVVAVSGIRKQFGAVQAVRNVSFSVAEGQSLCLLGPSGCGKTTMLRIIAGLETPDAGSVVIGGVEVTGLPPYARNIGLVFQDYALFPHMNVQENVAFGLRHRGVAKPEIPGRVAEALELVRLAGYEARRPAQLSGGQQQRVAVARALVTRPTVLLLDEPLSNLDAKLRVELRVQLRAILAEVRTTTIIVTHDQDEAMALADEIIVMNGGAIEQTGSPLEIYDTPRSRFVAEFIGRSNWLTGTVQASCGDGMAHLILASGETILVGLPDAAPGQSFDICLRPERLGILPASPAAAPDRGLNRLKGRVSHVEILGSQLHLYVTIGGSERLLAILSRAADRHEEGAEVDLVFRPCDALLIPRAPSGDGEIGIGPER